MHVQVLFSSIPVVIGIQKEIPSNFFGSPEVFSGYLSNQEDFIEAFTLHDDHVTIAGTIREVEQVLATLDTSGLVYMCTYVLDGKDYKNTEKYR